MGIKDFLKRRDIQLYDDRNGSNFIDFKKTGWKLSSKGTSPRYIDSSSMCTESQSTIALTFLDRDKNRYYMSSPTETISVGVEKHPCKSEILVKLKGKSKNKNATDFNSRHVDESAAELPDAQLFLLTTSTVSDDFGRSSCTHTDFPASLRQPFAFETNPALQGPVH